MNLDPIDFNYIDGENIYPLQEYIDEKITSNIYTNNVYITPTKKLDEVIYYSLSNLIIDNNTAFGEIQFKTSSSYPDDNTKIGTIIDFTGKLKVYHNYNILQPEFLAGYYDVENELLQLKADGINTDIQLGALEAGGVYLQTQITTLDEIMATINFKVDTLISGLGTQEEYETIADIANAEEISVAQDEFTDLMTTYSTRADTAYDRAIGLGIIGGVAVGLGGAVLGYLQTTREENIASNILKANIHLTEAEKGTILSGSAIIQSNINNIQKFNVSLSNLNINQGFINSGVQTTQTIPNISTSSITIGGVPLTTTLNNYVLKSGSTMTGTLTINGASGLSHQLILNNNEYSTFPNIKLSAGDVYNGAIGFGGLFSQNYTNNLFLESTGKIILNTNGNSISAIPNFIINTNGNVGIGVLNPIQKLTIGTAPTNTTVNVVMGIQNSAGITSFFGTGAPGLAGYYANNFLINARNDMVFYTDGQTALAIPNMIIKANGNVGIGVSNPSIKFVVDGGISATSLTTNSIIYNTQELSTSLSYYLLKTGGTLTGSILFNTQLFADPGPYPQGFNGDRIILNAGIGTNGYPYSIGVQSNLVSEVLWNCAPSTAGYKWYSGATNTMSLNNVGNLSLPSISSQKVSCVDATGVVSATLGRNFNVVGDQAVLRIWRNSIFSPAMEFMWGPTTASNSYIWFWDMYIGAGAGTANNYFVIRDRKGGGGVNRLMIDDGGNVGVGTTTNSSFKLFVSGSLYASSITVAGQLTGVTTLSATTGLFGTLATTNNFNVGAVGIGTFGGTGDKLILYAGSGSAYPYSLGINSSELWYSVPSGATHKFYNNGTNTLTINDNNLSVYGTKGISHLGPNLPTATYDSNNFANSCLYNAFGGDTNIYSYWGVSINLNSAGQDPANATHSRIQYTSSFTVNQKANGGTATSGFTNLFTIYQNGNVNINGDLSFNKTNLNIQLTATNGNNIAIPSTNGFFSSSANSNDMVIRSINNLILQSGSGSSAIYIKTNNNVGIGVASPNCKLDVGGVANIHNGSPYAITNGFMQSGSLTIGGTNADYGCQIYGGGGWSGNNTAGLLLECSNNTEIAVHDAGNRLVSLMAYYGGTVNVIEIGRNMGGGWAKPAIQIKNYASIEGNLTVFGRLATNQFYTTTDNQIITNTISIAPTSTAYNGYWQINIDAYKIVNQYNYLIFSCSVNYAGTVGYWTGRILVNGNGGGSIISVADFNTTNIYLSFVNLGGILYLWVNANGFYPTTNSLLYYKIIG